MSEPPAEVTVDPAPDDNDGAGDEPRIDRYDCTDPDERETGVKVALASLARNELVVLPTDTVYGIGVDAFSARGVSALLAAKGRGRDMPVPVLVGSLAALRALVLSLNEYGEALVEHFWPGPLTLVCTQQPSLRWDLGDARGTVAVRMPDQALAQELLRRHGPLAVSSANRSGRPPAATCDDAIEQLGAAVAVYLDDGPVGAAVEGAEPSPSSPSPSTIIDLTGQAPRLLRAGALSFEQLREVVPDLVEVEPRPAP